MRRALPWLLVGWVAIHAGPAGGVQRVVLVGGDAPLALEFGGEYRFQGTILTDVPVDAAGTTIGQPFVADQRLRGAMDLAGTHFRIGTEWDLFSGQMFGSTWAIPGDIDERDRHALTVLTPGGFVPRRANAQFRWPALTIELGLLPSHWGLGLVANDGAHDPMFGRADFGDRVVRLRFSVKPLYLQPENPRRHVLTVTGAFDWVIADDVARFDERQLALQGIASVLYADARDRHLGLYVVIRDQRELDDDRRLTAVVIDGYGQYPFVEADSGWGLRGAVEGALILGTTDRTTSYSQPEGARVRSGGAAGVLTVHAPGKRLQLHLRGGIASGDADPDDDLSGTFTFDRDFDVGMVLFDQLGGAVEANAHALLTDPTRSPPPDGVDAIATEGAFRRAFFAQPVLQAEATPWLGFKLGVLVATGTVDWTHPYYTFRAGGAPRNHLDAAPEGRFLGTEVDWAVRLGGALRPVRPDSVRLELLAQGGHLFPGPALRGEGQASAIHQWLLTARLRW